MMEYNPTTVSATYKTTSWVSSTYVNEVVFAGQLLLPLSIVYYIEPTFLHLLLKFQVLSHGPYMKDKMWLSGNLTMKT